MTRETYQKITGLLRGRSSLTAFVRGVNRILTGCVFIVYPVFLVLLFLRQDTFLVRAVFVPAISFVLVSVFRRSMNVPRPYERFDIPPVIEKDTKGNSFPSRHVFSVFVIAVTVFFRYPLAGVLLMLAGLFLGIIRVIGGVHTPLDVITGAVIGILCGVAGYYLIPYGFLR